MVNEDELNDSDISSADWTPENIEKVFDLPINTLYKYSIKFYKEKERNGELQLEYATRLQFMAYFKQAKYGAFKEEAADCGWFDLVGNDTRKEWKKLGSLSTEQAMVEFVRLFDIVCPAFRPHIKKCRELEAPKIVLGEAQVNRLESLVDESSAESQEILLRYQQQRQQIQEALNKQTYHQFLAYAQQTHPGEPEKQEELIKQLQEQHYEQYMSQVYAQQSQAQVASMLEDLTVPPRSADTTNVSESSTNSSVGSNGCAVSTDDSEAGPKAEDAYLQKGLERPPRHQRPRHKVKVVDDERGNTNEDGTVASDVSDDEEANPTSVDDTPLFSVHGQMGLFCYSNPKIAPASLWNSKNVQEFKDAIRKEGTEGILKIGHGETVTVRVPTHEEGVCLFWEFATDYYDLGFGVYFEWTIAESNQVTVHVSESSDEDYDEDELGGEGGALPPPPGGDVAAAEAGANPLPGGGGYRRSRKHDPNKPPIDEVIPIYRRDCHEQVFAGSHIYPGRGVYLLKFDNTFSLWRSKTLYYRVFYSK